MTKPLEHLLTALLTDPSADWYGYELVKSAKLASGTLYPMLARMEQRGLVTSEWEPPPGVAGRPPRKYYRLTAEGALVARQLPKAPQTSSLRLAGSS
jgi:DNA-binding PadR family transcriptional regulator